MRLLPKLIAAQICLLNDKQITGKIGTAWITRISETEAVIQSEMELNEWDDVRLHLELKKLPTLTGKMYAKVLSVKTTEEGSWEAHLHFTSMPSQLHRFFQEIVTKNRVLDV